MAYSNNSVNQANAMYTKTNTSVTKKTNSTLGKDDFLNLLVTQLRYQDPMNPMEDREFIAQSAQFSSLEQMQNINANFAQFLQMQALSNSAALIDKEVSYFQPAENEGEEPEIKKGKVSEIKFVDGQTYMTIDKQDIPLEYLVSIKGKS